MAMSIMLSPTPPLTLGRNHCLRSSHRVNTSIRSSSTSETNGRPGEGGPNRLDRRNILILIGLGGLYGATTLGGTQMAVGSPVEPELTACHTAKYPDAFGDNNPVECCPPYDLTNLSDVKQYVIPTNMTLRRRKPAHKLSQFEKDRFKTAIKEMMRLPNKHPWNFMQQAQVHCAFCNDAYYQINTNKVPYQVHFNWIFPPWHRYYLYFFERILGKIIDDESIALPFWNYDVEDGMKIPHIYTDPSSSLYNPNRNLTHFDQYLNLNYSYDIEDSDPPPDVVQQNLTFLWKLFRNSKPFPSLFTGDPVRTGDFSDINLTIGVLESMHNTVHSWVGSAEAPNRDMGSLFSSARDPIFYGHHANVDRLWELYRTSRGYKLEFNDNDWLKAAYYFYDENQKLVYVKTEDALKTSDLGYEYEDVPVKYLSSTPPIAATPTKPTPPSKVQPVKIGEFGPSPRKLSESIRVVVNRPKASRTPANKIDETEILVIEGIEVLDPEAVRFDVYINTVNKDNFVVGLGNFVGSYTRLRHIHMSSGGMPVKTKLKLGITSEVEDLGADAAVKLAVNLVPRNGQVNIGGVQIQLVKADY